MKTISGQCYCGDFKFTITGKLDAVSICHCNVCRQHSGADYTTWVTVGKGCFNANRDLKSLDKFSFSEKSDAYFCKVCHTKIISSDAKYPDVFGIPRGVFRDGADNAQKYGGDTGFKKVISEN